MSIRQVDLDAKYTAKQGAVFMTGIQALVRLPIMQYWRDQEIGLNTAGYVTGYRGSPLGTVDQAMQKAEKYLSANQIKFHPGLNEDLAATAVWGTQQVNLFEGAKVDGVFALWYGKGPGVDRSADAIKHGNAAGTSAKGGVLLIVGDDHAAKSSTFPHQSDHILAASMVPVLSPSGVQEVLDYGILGWEMSRYSGCWVALKAISDTVESAAIVDANPKRIQVQIPDDFPIPESGLNIRWPDTPLVQEERLLHHRLYAVLAFARANQINRITLDSPKARLGIATTGKSYLDVMQALADLGIDEQLAQDIGLRIFKVGMVWPLEAEGVRQFAKGLDEILVIEEKRQVIEYQLKEQLYNWDENIRPRVVGKFAEKGEWAMPHGDWLLPAAGELTPAMIARAIANRLANIFDSPIIHDRLDFYNKKEAELIQPRESINRVPHYCSGCPHNTSTKVPEGSRALAGIGCHYMAMWIHPDSTKTFTQMGGEGVTWIGQAPFTETKHVFTNLGDGTYFHSGILAIRAAIAANVNITYKILYNDAVAMTGGQSVDGFLSVPMLTQQLAAEGIQHIALTSDTPEVYKDMEGIVPLVTIHDRSELDQVQKNMRDISGVSVIIHAQTCAAEKRRRRKRQQFPDPAKRMIINTEVCEGCGDCGEKSGCLSITPIATPLGRKRAIDQSSCNKDYTCANGFCPSFVSILGSQLKKPSIKQLDISQLPTLSMPILPSLDHPYSIMITGVGGTGVVTIGQVLGVAAHLDYKGATVLDMAGLAQKGGAVWSHVRLAPQQEQLYAVRIAAGDANLILGCDLVVSASAEALAKMRKGTTTAVINTYESPTSDVLKSPDMLFPSQSMLNTIRQAVGDKALHDVNATEIAVKILGDAIAGNMFILGYAWQKGLIPLTLDAIMQAIALNAVSVQFNQTAFTMGRHAAQHPEALKKWLTPSTVIPFVPRETCDTIISDRVKRLSQYQNAQLAKRFETLVKTVRQKEEALSDHSSLTQLLAKVYYHILAYKDEYEVARLLTDPAFKAQIADQFEGHYKLAYNLGATWLTLGKSHKVNIGQWVNPGLKLLSKLKFLRGSVLDPFRWQADRQLDRQLIQQFETDIQSVVQELNRDNLAQLETLLKAYASIKGFGHVKQKRYEIALVTIQQSKLAILAKHTSKVA